eukprot:12907630-Prorocentrum_lima.AAC.1
MGGDCVAGWLRLWQSGGSASDEPLNIRIEGRRTGHCLHRGVWRDTWEEGVVPKSAGEPARGARIATQ